MPTLESIHGQEGNMTDNNNTTINFDDLGRTELIDLLESANNQVTNLVESIDTLREENSKNVERIRAVVDKFRSALIEGDDVTIDDWDALQEYFDDFDGIADLEPPVRHFIFEFSTSTTKRYAVRVTDPSLTESDIEDRLVEAIDTYQRVDFMPSELDGIEDIEDEDYSTDFDVDDSSLSSND
jgi:hypothetical protein